MKPQIIFEFLDMAKRKALKVISLDLEYIASTLSKFMLMRSGDQNRFLHESNQFLGIIGAISVLLDDYGDLHEVGFGSYFTDV